MATTQKSDVPPAEGTAAPAPGKKSGHAAELKALRRDVERLRAIVDELEAKLAKQEKKKARWKSEAKAARTRAAKLDAALRRARTPRPLEHDGDVPVQPSAAWTVLRLRAAARERGVVGTSRMTKAQLLDTLQG